MKTSQIKLKTSLKPYPEYKDSGIDWIGEIPKDWEIASHRRLFSTKKIAVGSRAHEYKVLSLTLKGIIPRVMDGSGKNPAEYDTYQVFRKGDLSFCLFDYDVTPRTIGYVNEDGMMTGAYTRLIPKKEVFSKYFYYYFLSLDNTKELLHLCTGLRNSISKPLFWSMKSSFPNIETQEKIAEYLDEKTELIDQIVEKKKKLIELLKEKRTAIINQAVTKGLDPNAEFVDSGIDWIGETPKDWRAKKIKFVTQLKYGESLSADLRVDGSVSVYGSNGEVGKHSISNTNSETILVGRKGSFGSVVFSEHPVFAIDTVYYIDKSCTSVNLYWLRYVLSVANLSDVSQDTGVPGLSRSTAYEKYIPVPSDKNQNEITEFLSKKLAKQDRSIDKVKQSIIIMQEFKLSLISNVVTGKVKV